MFCHREATIAYNPTLVAGLLCFPSMMGLSANYASMMRLR
jgi:hypothetical protein